MTGVYVRRREGREKARRCPRNDVDNRRTSHETGKPPVAYAQRQAKKREASGRKTKGGEDDNGLVGGKQTRERLEVAK